MNKFYNAEKCIDKINQKCVENKNENFLSNYSPNSSDNKKKTTTKWQVFEQFFRPR